MNARAATLCASLSLGVVVVCTASCRARPFWQCTDPEVPLRSLPAPPESWLVHERGPGLFDSPCAATATRTFGTNVSELQVAEAMSDELTRAGFARVAARADSPFWCARAQRFHQFTRGDLVLRFAVEPIPFDDGRGGVVRRGQARYAVHVMLRNFDEAPRFQCAR